MARGHRLAGRNKASARRSALAQETEQPALGRFLGFRLAAWPQSLPGPLGRFLLLVPGIRLVLIRLQVIAFDLAEFGLTANLRAAYQALPVKASACTECGACAKHCPFGVDVIPRIRQAVEVFERRGR